MELWSDHGAILLDVLLAKYDELIKNRPDVRSQIETLARELEQTIEQKHIPETTQIQEAVVETIKKLSTPYYDTLLCTPFQMYDVIPTLWCCMKDTQREKQFKLMTGFVKTMQVKEPFKILKTIEDIVVQQSVSEEVLTKPSSKDFRTVVIYTDIGKDIDDTINAIVALTLLKVGYITKLVFVTCGGAEDWRVNELLALINKLGFTQGLTEQKVFVIAGTQHTPALNEQSQYNVLHGTTDTRMFNDCSLQSKGNFSDLV
jgi:cell division septum initiation protein DivIVA